MPNGGRFYSEEQEANFRAANVLHRRGGALEVVCGARTRTGAACQGKPVSGSGRCIKHCGPKAAREFRERQREAYLSGKLSHADWARAEAKREANRLRERWKKDQWGPGATIDLGEHEWIFQQESGLAARSGASPVPPAVLDWLRWRFRRLQIDRKQDRAWLQVLREELPKRLLAAGPATADAIVRQEQERASAVMKWQVADAEPFSKRARLDPPKAPVKVKPRSLRGPGRPRTRPAPDMDPDQQAETGMFVFQHREILARMFERCRADEQAMIIEALRTFVVNPNDRAVRERWVRIVSALGLP